MQARMQPARRCCTRAGQQRKACAHCLRQMPHDTVLHAQSRRAPLHLAATELLDGTAAHCCHEQRTMQVRIIPRLATPPSVQPPP